MRSNGRPSLRGCHQESNYVNYVQLLVTQETAIICNKLRIQHNSDVLIFPVFKGMHWFQNCSQNSWYRFVRTLSPTGCDDETATVASHPGGISSFYIAAVRVGAGTRLSETGHSKRAGLRSDVDLERQFVLVR